MKKVFTIFALEFFGLQNSFGDTIEQANLIEQSSHDSIELAEDEMLAMLVSDQEFNKTCESKRFTIITEFKLA